MDNKQLEGIHEMAQIALGKQVTIECTKFAIEEGFFDNFIALYNANYRRIDEGSIVFTKEEFEELRQTIITQSKEFTELCDEINNAIIRTRKQAIGELIERLKKKARNYSFGDKVKILNAFFIEDIDEVVKEMGVKPDFTNHTSDPDWN